MTLAELLLEAFGRIHGVVRGVLEGLSPEELASRPADGANSIGWLVWHLTRIQDDHVADAAGCPQVWDREWAERMAVPGGAVRHSRSAFQWCAGSVGQNWDQDVAGGVAGASRSAGET